MQAGLIGRPACATAGDHVIFVIIPENGRGLSVTSEQQRIFCRNILIIVRQLNNAQVVILTR